MVKSQSNSSEQKLSLGALIGLVVGSMIGSGIFALPSAFGRATGALGGFIAWGIAGVGMLFLAFVFQTLSRRKPDLNMPTPRLGLANMQGSRRRRDTGWAAVLPMSRASS
jgi:hypothetical protein